MWLDADLTFSVLRLSAIIKDKLLRARPDLSQSEVEALAYQALQHVHTFRPQSSLQVLETLLDLPNYLLFRCTHYSDPHRLACIILDSTTSFFWQDRLDASTATASKPAANAQSSPSPAQQIAKHLQSLQRRFDCAILYTTNARNGGSGSSNQIHLLQSLQRYVKASLTLSLSRQSTHQFPPHLSLQQCLSDQPQRLTAMQNGKFTASRARGERGGDTDLLRERLDRVGEKAVVNFWIKADGVGIEE